MLSRSEYDRAKRLIADGSGDWFLHRLAMDPNTSDEFDDVYRARAAHPYVYVSTKPIPPGRGSVRVHEGGAVLTFERAPLPIRSVLEYGLRLTRESKVAFVIALAQEQRTHIELVRTSRPRLVFVIHPSTRAPGLWQMTHFDTHGPSGDTQNARIEPLVEEALYSWQARIFRPGTLDPRVGRFDAELLEKITPRSNPTPRRRAQPGYEGLGYLLAARGDVHQIGTESGRAARDGVSVFVHRTEGVGESRRYVYAVAGRIVSALQVMVRPTGEAVAANVYTLPAHRRSGLAAKLLAQAQRDLPALGHSADRSPAGEAWVRSREPRRNPDPLIENWDSVQGFMPDVRAAAQRAVAAGAKAPLEYLGIGAYGIVFRDGRRTWKVARGNRAARSIAEEYEWFRTANQVPWVRDHVVRVYAWHAGQGVMERESLEERRSSLGWPRPPARDTHAVHMAIQDRMIPYGWSAPEYKHQSYIHVRGRGAVLFDGSSAHLLGSRMARHVTDVLDGRRAPDAYEDAGTLAFYIRREISEGALPAHIGARLLERIEAWGRARQNPRAVTRR